MANTQPVTVVIAYCLAGIGHRRAAEALAQALRAHGRAVVHLVDILDYMPAWFRALYPRLYLFCVHRLPWVWAALFTVTNLTVVERLKGPGRRWMNRCLGRRFMTWLTTVRPDVLVNTHFLPPDIVSPRRRRALPGLQVWSLVTDYWPHVWWKAPGVDRYFAGLEETQTELIARGVDPRRITVSGLPVDRQFSIVRDRAPLITTYQLEAQRLTLLVTSGGYGIGPVERLCRSLIDGARAAQDRVQLVIVAGENRPLKARLEALAHAAPCPVRVLGFTREMPELMTVADVVLTKPGGMTVTEALVAGRPLVLFAPIWGQETGNARLLVHHGLARLLRRPEDAGPLIAQWLQHPEELAAMRERIDAMRRQPAADIIWSHLP